MPFSRISWPSTRTRSSSWTPSSSEAWAIRLSKRTGASLKTILDPGWGERGARPARGMALHVHGHRIHGDVRGRSLDVHCEGSRVAAEALRADAKHVHCLPELALELRSL